MCLSVPAQNPPPGARPAVLRWAPRLRLRPGAAASRAASAATAATARWALPPCPVGSLDAARACTGHHRPEASRAATILLYFTPARKLYLMRSRAVPVSRLGAPALAGATAALRSQDNAASAARGVCGAGPSARRLRVLGLQEPRGAAAAPPSSNDCPSVQGCWPCISSPMEGPKDWLASLATGRPLSSAAPSPLSGSKSIAVTADAVCQVHWWSSKYTGSNDLARLQLQDKEEVGPNRISPSFFISMQRLLLVLLLPLDGSSPAFFSEGFRLTYCNCDTGSSECGLVEHGPSSFATCCHLTTAG